MGQKFFRGRPEPNEYAGTYQEREFYKKFLAYKEKLNKEKNERYIEETTERSIADMKRLPNEKCECLKLFLIQKGEREKSIFRIFLG